MATTEISVRLLKSCKDLCKFQDYGNKAISIYIKNKAKILSVSKNLFTLVIFVALNTNGDSSKVDKKKKLLPLTQEVSEISQYSFGFSFLMFLTKIKVTLYILGTIIRKKFDYL